MIRVCVLGIEPISPASGGSRQRLKGLYQDPSDELDVRYVGAYHWRGETIRRIRLDSQCVELVIPFSDAHCDEIELLATECPGISVIDVSFPRFGYLTPDLTVHATKVLRQADVVVFSQPWMAAVVGEAIDHSRQLVVYDAHNMEFVRWSGLLPGTKTGADLIDEVRSLEEDLCLRADLIITCSEDDRQQFFAEYGINPGRTTVVPNGTFGNKSHAAPSQEIVALVSKAVADAEYSSIFVGGNYLPNRESVSFIVETLAPNCPELVFIVVGSVADNFRQSETNTQLPHNVLFTGGIGDDDRDWLLSLVDIGLNPMFSGSGSNIKMFDYFAAGLPVLSTPFGGRGIPEKEAFVCAEADQFVVSLRQLIHDPARRKSLAIAARSLGSETYRWAHISRRLGDLLSEQWHDKSIRACRVDDDAPLFSVTVPTLDRPDRLRRLLDRLVMQTEQNFEVIIVDQSDQPFVAERFSAALDITVLHSEIKGACRARNRAASVARGKYLVFTDDDCEPASNWLWEARIALQPNGVVGLEGRTHSDRLDESDWRSVHNHGVESLGFMTCNLFCTAEAFASLGGFDTRFDLHDFRYDTDFGWRLQTLGVVPFCEHAWVYHPPWPRSISRESAEVRNLMFGADALLLKKHPQRYRQLFEAEEHWRSAAFWPPFLAGAAQFQVDLPDYVIEARARSQRELPDISPAGDAVNRIAYAFYATSNQYAEAVLIAARRLMQFSQRTSIDYVVSVHDVSDAMLERLRLAGLKIKQCASLEIANDAYYRYCLTKLRVFQLFEYQRVIYLDADTLPLQSLDYLFDLPDDVELAAPRAYWLDQPWVTSMLLVVKPSPQRWERVCNHLATARLGGYYDMEIINYEFADELLFLDDRYGCLNTHLIGGEKPCHFGDPDTAIDTIPIVHYSVPGKPWEHTTEELSELVPGASQTFLTLWETWRREREHLRGQ